MKKFKASLSAVLSAALVFGLGFGRLFAEESKESESAEVSIPEAVQNEDVKLADWEGMWNSMHLYLDKETLQDAYKTLGEKENMSAEDAKKAYVEKRACDFGGLKIEGDKITFYETFPADEKGEALKDAKEIGTYTYKYVESYKVKHGDSELEWDVFTTDDKDAKFPMLFLMPQHGEETLVHFHLRYGKSVEEIFGKDKWYPTFVAPDTTDEMLVDEITE